MTEKIPRRLLAVSEAKKSSCTEFQNTSLQRDTESEHLISRAGDSVEWNRMAYSTHEFSAQPPNTGAAEGN